MIVLRREPEDKFEQCRSVTAAIPSCHDQCAWEKRISFDRVGSFLVGSPKSDTQTLRHVDATWSEPSIFGRSPTPEGREKKDRTLA